MTELIQYQNANQTNEDVIKNFIIRHKEFDRVIDDIRTTQDGASFQHYVFVGRRGSGKSTLLRRIEAEINLDLNLNNRFIAVNLGEEQSGIYKLYDLWDYVIRSLNAKGYNIPPTDFRIYKDNMKDFTKALHGQIISTLQSNNKKLILLVDNIDRVLSSRGNDEDAAMLRELLMNFKDIRIVGGSTVMSEHFWRYDMPFYEFFSIKKLENLSLVEIEKLLVHWSEQKKLPEIKDLIKKYPGKIQSIRMLTDGMPRTMLLFVDMLIDRPQQHGYQYLQLIVDRATPIYQERLAQLPPAQNKVLTELAFFWDAASVDQLISRCNMDGKTISALLNQLSQIRYVEKIKGRTKNHLYRLEERFFNLWFNMTQGGPQQRHEAKALTDFLENWYNKTELKSLCFELSHSLTSGEITQDYAASMSVALLNSKKIPKEAKQNLYINAKKSGLVETKYLSDAKKYFGDFDEAITKAFVAKDYNKAIEILKISDINQGKNYYGLGLCYFELNNFAESENYFHLAFENNEIRGLFGLAFLFEFQGKESESEKFYMQAIKYGNMDALNNLTLSYFIGNKKAKLNDLIKNVEKKTLGVFVKNKTELASMIYLYLGDIQKYKILSDQLLQEGSDIVKGIFLITMLEHKQTNWVLNYFNIKPIAIEEYKPIYYTALTLQGNNDQELLKMPPEIAKNVNDIILKVKERQEFYYG